MSSHGRWLQRQVRFAGIGSMPRCRPNACRSRRWPRSHMRSDERSQTQGTEPSAGLFARLSETFATRAALSSEVHLQCYPLWSGRRHVRGSDLNRGDTMTTFIPSHGLRSQTFGCVAAVAIMSLSLDVSAQTSSGSEWHRGTTLAGFVGAGSTSADTTVATGTALGWEIGPHFTMEGRGNLASARSGHGGFLSVDWGVDSLAPASECRPVCAGRSRHVSGDGELRVA